MPLYNPTPQSVFLQTLFALLPTPAIDVIINNTVHLTEDLFCLSLNITNTGKLYTDNYRVYSLTSIINYGQIINKGADGTAGTLTDVGLGGVNPSSGTIAKAADGQDGTINGSDGNDGTAKLNCIGFQGGTGGAAGIFIGGAAGTLTNPPLNAYYQRYAIMQQSIPNILSAQAFNLVANSGSGSGAADIGTAGSGGSGAGGGIIMLCCITLINHNLINVQGGNAGASYNDGSTKVGGSGSGCGGIIYIIASQITIGTTLVLAGNPQTGKNGGIAGTQGGSGTLITQNFH